MSENDIEAARRAAHDAPLNTVHTDHKGRRSLGTHSSAWWKASRRYFELLEGCVDVG